VWLPWDFALWIAAAVGIAWWFTRRRSDAWGRTLAPLCKESALLLVIYAAWRKMGELSLMSTDGAMHRGRWIWHLERSIRLPNEVTLQRWTLHLTWLVRFANAYYIVCHVAPLGIFLVWLYVRHRDAFGHWRNQLAFVSIVCLTIQYIPVAPPRLLPDLGFIDTAAVYGPRVYDSVGVSTAGQLAAMPSMHVAWAMLVAIACVSVSRSKWRWVAAGHASLTVFAVTVTAYHWLLDGMVGTAVLLIGMAVAERWSRRSTAAGVASPDGHDVVELSRQGT
jgi:PAP2 superfamily